MMHNLKANSAIILKVAVDSPFYEALDYLPPKGMDQKSLHVGQRLKVSLGKRVVTGVLLAITDHSSLATARLKPVLGIIDAQPLLPADTLALLNWASDYYQYPIGQVVSHALPVLLRKGQVAALKGETCWQLSDAWRPEYIEQLKRAPKQHVLLSHLLASHDPLTSTALDCIEPQWRVAMAKLVERGWVESHRQLPVTAIHPDSVGQENLALNPAQQDAVESIHNCLGQATAFLVDGVTGSGKTEVYLCAIAEALQRGLQALVLVPEIGLTPQLLDRFRQRFPTQAIAVLHSGLTDAVRLQAWLLAAQGHARIVIGTRSAIFTPLPDLGLIVVDEEHDLSYKQQEGFRYSARDLALVRSQRGNCPVLLGSATPSLETLYNLRQGRYQRLHLPERAGGAQMPEVRIMDMRAQPMQEGLSEVLLQALKTQLDAGHQVMVFLNRRGYAPVLLCHACGWVAACARCDSHMTLYHSRNILRCQHCDSQRPVDTTCPSCGSDDLIPIGEGTERLEQVLKQRFPETPVLRVDRDSTRRKGALEKTLEQVAQDEPCILIGTQMLAKGHHFPAVTFVGIVNVDQGLFSADFRATERMAQLIVQVSGRAGRAERPGRVMIQTHHPQHPFLTSLVEQGYAACAEILLAERQQAELPPFHYLALLRAEAVQAELPQTFLSEVAQLAQQLNPGPVQVLGPVAASMERRAGRYRAQLLLQAAERRPLHQLLRGLIRQLPQLKSARRVRWSVDVDPQEMF